MDVALMLEGQDGLTWERLERIAQVVEDGGFAGLFRSDHITSANGPVLESLEAWVSFTWLATHTKRLKFGPLVSPVSFREPVMLTRMALAVDDLPGGRLTFGVGAGWQEREHTMFGYDLLDTRQRLDRFEEALEVITRLLRSDEPVSYEGRFYRLREAILLPRPQRQGGPPLLIGGNGPKRTLPLAARYADEWNAVFVPAERVRELNARLDELIEQHGRRPGDVRRSLMTQVIFGRDDAEVERKLQGRSAAELRERGLVVGTANDIVDQIGVLADAGVDRIMLQGLDLDDIDRLGALARAVVPQLT